MKRLHVLVSVAAGALVALAPAASRAQDVKARAPAVALTKAQLFAPQYHAGGGFVVVQVVPAEGKRAATEKLLRDFGAGAEAEKQAYAFAAAAMATASGSAPIVVKRVLKHYRCPKRAVDGGGSGSDTDCLPVKIGYTLPPDPTDAAALAECGITVNADVIYLGRRAKTIKWVMDPPSPPAQTAAGTAMPRIRLLDLAYDAGGQPVRGITFSDNTEDPQELGEPPAGTNPVFDTPVTAADGQSVVWTRVRAKAGLAKVFYYAVVLQLWSDTLQDYVFCAPYDPTIANRGN